MKKLKQLMVLCLILAVFMTACAKDAGEVDKAVEIPAAEAIFKAGTYEALADGNNGPLKVEVTFSDSKIESVTVKEHTETAGLSDPAINDVPVKIVELQSLDVDVITGATVTSRAIKYAVADCVKQAGGEDNSLLKVDLDRPSESEKFFISAVESINKPEAVNGVIEVNTYDELKRALGYYDYIVNPDTKEGKFVYIDGSAAEGNTIKIMSDLTAEGDKDNPKFADQTDKADVMTGATVLVTDNVTIDGNGKTIKGEGYPTFAFVGKSEDYGNGAVKAELININIEDGAYTAKIGGAVFVEGAAEVDVKDSNFINNAAKSAKLAFNGGGAIYVTSGKMTPDVGRAVLNVTNCTFTGNTTANGGGAALMGLHGDINVFNSKFTENKSLSPAGVGGAIAVRGTSKLLVDGSEITGNEATIAGGGVYVFDGESMFKGDAVLTNTTSAVIKNSIIENNIAANGKDVVYGRYYSDAFAGDKTRNGLDVTEGNTIGESLDLTFTSVERTEIAK